MAAQVSAALVDRAMWPAAPARPGAGELFREHAQASPTWNGERSCRSINFQARRSKQPRLVLGNGPGRPQVADLAGVVAQVVELAEGRPTASCASRRRRGSVPVPGGSRRMRRGLALDQHAVVGGARPRTTGFGLACMPLAGATPGASGCCARCRSSRPARRWPAACAGCAGSLHTGHPDQALVVQRGFCITPCSPIQSPWSLVNTTTVSGPGPARAALAITGPRRRRSG